jgi:hypothetical protein
MEPNGGEDLDFCGAGGEGVVVVDCVAAGEGVEEVDCEREVGDEVVLWLEAEVEELEEVEEEAEPVMMICKPKSFPIPT